jgi:hypothetical protein
MSQHVGYACYILSVKSSSSFFYSLDGHILQQVQSNPHLGLTFSDDLKWNIHIDNINKKASYTLGFLCRNLRH